MTSSTSPYQRILEEFRSSALPDRLTHANVQWIEGEWAVQAMAETAIAKCQRVTSYVTVPAARILKSYEYAADGGWISYGCDLQGNRGDVAYFKPFNPPKELKNGKLKSIKYPTPQGAEALPVMPWVDPETAHEIYQRYSVTPLEGELFWQVVWRCNIPVAICEGLKKALSLIAHGIPAVALRGVTCWHKKGSPELHAALAHFATPKRTIYLVFDQDEKASTQRDVRIQLTKLGNALEDIGCLVKVPVWDRKLGKGIDDALYGKGEAAQAWLDDLVKNAPSLKDYKRYGRIAAAIAAIERLNQLSFPIERETTGEYLPELPPFQRQRIHAIVAAMNSGKTTAIRYWVKQAIDLGMNVLVLAPLNSLGKQTSRDWDLPHIHSFGTSAEQQQALWSMVSASHGVVLCPDSLHRIPDWFWSRPTLLILDEANQVIDHLATGNTLGDRYSDILEGFSAAACHAIESGSIVLSEDGLPDRAVKFIQGLTGATDEAVSVFRHNKQGQPWNCTVFQGTATQTSGFRARMLQSAVNNRILIATSSQRETRRLQRALAKLAPSRSVIRIASDTNQRGEFDGFFDNPDQWLQEHQPDVLILSPSAKSGISIEGKVSPENAYFSQVWGYFPALATDTHLQLLGRYRPPVPRFIFVPPFILGDSNEGLMNPRAIRRKQQGNLSKLAGAYDLTEFLETTDRTEQILKIETAVLDYLAEAKTVSGCQKSVALDALVTRLEQSGHRVRLEKISSDKPTSELWKAVQEELWRGDAEAIAQTIIEAHHTPEWARKTLDSLEVALETRILAQKVLWRLEFPGVLFDDLEECYQVLCQEYGMMRRGVLLQAGAENLEAAKAGDRQSVESCLRAKIRAPHRLPKNYARAWLMSQTGILALLDGTTYSNADSRAIAVKKVALHYAKEIGYWFRLQIKKEQTPVEICNKLLKKLSLKAEALKGDGVRPGRRGEKRNVHYSIADLDDPVRARLLRAARRKLSESVSAICNKQNPLYQIADTPPKQETNSPPMPGCHSPANQPQQAAETLQRRTSVSVQVERGSQAISAIHGGEH